MATQSEHYKTDPHAYVLNTINSYKTAQLTHLGTRMAIIICKELQPDVVTTDSYELERIITQSSREELIKALTKVYSIFKQVGKTLGTVLVK